jgi:ATP-dependent helicase/nuclease subunit B
MTQSAEAIRMPLPETIVERSFLGWHAGFLARVAGRLTDHYAAGSELRMETAVVAVPGSRAGRRLKELLAVEAGTRGMRLVPPRITTPAGLATLLCDAPAPAPAPGLVASLRAWAVALRDLEPSRRAVVFPAAADENDLLAWTRRARAIHRAHVEIAGAGLTFDRVAGRCREGLAFSDHERWEVLSEAQAAYASILEGLGTPDPDLARLQSLRDGGAVAAGEVWLVGIADLPRALAALIEVAARDSGTVRALIQAPESEAGSFDRYGCVVPEAWRDREIPLTDGDVAIVGSPGEQAEEVMRFLASLGGAFAPDEIAVAVPDREVVSALGGALAADGVAFHDAAGDEAARSGPARLLAAVAEYLDGRRYDAAAALARHPDLAVVLTDAAPEEPGGWWIEALDEHFAARLPSRLEPGRVVGSRACDRAVARLLSILHGPRLLGRFSGERTASAWMPELLGLLAEVYGGAPLERESPRDRTLVGQLVAVREAAGELHALPPALDEPCDAAAAIRLLIDSLHGSTVPNPGEGAAVEFLGWLELELDDAPVAVVTGFNERFLPASFAGDPLLPDALRARIGVMDDARRYARDAYVLTALLSGRERVRVIGGRRSETGDPLRPSRLLFAVPRASLPGRVRAFYGDTVDGAAGGLRTEGARSGFACPPEPVITSPTPITSLRVSAFSAILADPYGFALDHVLGLEEVDDDAREVDPLAFGDVAHRVLAAFGSSEAAASSDPVAVRGALDALLDAEARSRFGGGAMPAVRLQIEQLRARLHAFAGWQARRVSDGWRIVATECAPPDGKAPFEVDGEPFGLRGRIDRIDHHPDRGWEVLDYKTSERGDPPEATHRVGPASAKRWVDLQLPLYRHLAAALAGEDGRPLLPAGAAGALGLGYIVLSRAAETDCARMATWTPEDLQSADEAAREVVRLVRTGTFAHDPARVGRYVGGGVAALRGIGHLVGSSNEEEGAE